MSFQAPAGTATAALYKFLDERFALSLRQDSTGADWMRVSPHFMNGEDDIEALAAAIREYRP